MIWNDGHIAKRENKTIWPKFHNRGPFFDVKVRVGTADLAWM